MVAAVSHSKSEAAMPRGPKGEQQPSYTVGAPRPLTEAEIGLLTAMLRGHETTEPLMKGLAQARVQAMNDGGMGSIRFVEGAPNHRGFGRIVREVSFKDKDGVPVLASIIVDQSGELYELDLWKADFAPLSGIPDPSQLLLDPPIRRIRK
jgi:hypothetical protein